MQDMIVREPPRGYFPELTKIILVFSPWNTLSVEEYFRGMGVSVVTGNCYLRGFIGDPVTEKAWLDENIKG